MLAKIIGNSSKVGERLTAQFEVGGEGWVAGVVDKEESGGDGEHRGDGGELV